MSDDERYNHDEEYAEDEHDFSYESENDDNFSEDGGEDKDIIEKYNDEVKEEDQEYVDEDEVVQEEDPVVDIIDVDTIDDKSVSYSVNKVKYSILNTIEEAAVISKIATLINSGRISLNDEDRKKVVDYRGETKTIAYNIVHRAKELSLRLKVRRNNGLGGYNDVDLRDLTTNEKLVMTDIDADPDEMSITKSYFFPYKG